VDGTQDGIFLAGKTKLTGDIGSQQKPHARKTWLLSRVSGVTGVVAKTVQIF
jgi:hypothetical protein